MNKITSQQYYSFPLLLALSLHILVLAFLLFELAFPVKSSPGAASSQSVIQATAISQQTLDNYENQVQATKEAEIKQQELQQQIAREKVLKQQELERQQLLKQQQMQRQIELQKQKAIEMAKEKAMAAQKAAQEKAQAEKAAAEKTVVEKAAVAKAKKYAEEKAMKKSLQKALAQDMQKELASDQHELNHSEQHATTNTPSPSAAPVSEGMIDKYKAMIIQAISSQWIVPSNLAQNISCELDVRVAPGGTVLQVSISRSSGNPVLDNSAVAAVNKASPLPVPTDSSTFSQFRELHITVKPDGSMTA